jgi:hypothetical protein
MTAAHLVCRRVMPPESERSLSHWTGCLWMARALDIDLEESNCIFFQMQ